MKLIQLTAPAEDEALGLKKGEAYYVVTHVEGVTGLKEFIEAIVPSIPVDPVVSVNGLKGIVILTARGIGALDKNGKASDSFKADQAIKLSRPVTINGVPFDGSKNIILPIPDISNLEEKVTSLEMMMKNAIFNGKE